MPLHNSSLRPGGLLYLRADFSARLDATLAGGDVSGSRLQESVADSVQISGQQVSRHGEAHLHGVSRKVFRAAVDRHHQWILGLVRKDINYMEALFQSAFGEAEARGVCLMKALHCVTK